VSAPFVDTGSLRHRITIMQPGSDDNRGPNGEIGESTVFAKRWASVSPMSGSESYRAQQFVSDANIQIVIRYLAGVEANMTIEFQERTFQVLYVLDELSMKVKLVLFCKEIL
jgi:SPP1 family predicted phage head-tail adaptor